MPFVKYDTPEDAFWNNIDFSLGGDCWIWNSDRGRFWDGYGRASYHRKEYRAHRLSYLLNIGPVPDGLHVCHTCDVRDCVNPAHLFLGSRSDNMKDMISKKRGRNQVKTHCVHGHEFSESNTKFKPNGNRMCVACAGLREKRAEEKFNRGCPPVHKKTHCSNGHEYTPENAFDHPRTGLRRCRACARERYKRKKGMNIL